ncbi:MAG: UDP-N-acetylmuramate dehydrogenase [Patescibacteria group bacterium UBA2163]
MHTHQDLLFKDLTTLKVGGEARRVIVPETRAECIRALEAERNDFFILGGGSNVLAKDEPYTGVVYRMEFQKITHADIDTEEVLVHVDAGTNWDVFVAHTVENEWWGIENLSAIPGTVGGAVFQNIGAYGAALSETCVSVDVYDHKDRRERTIKNEDCAFDYRTSIFKMHVPRYTILSATFRLSRTPAPCLDYRDLEEHFKDKNTPSAGEVRDAVCAIRKNKFPESGAYGSAGSFFLNPVLPEAEASIFQNTYPRMPIFSLPEGGVKIPLAWLLDHVVGAKGMRVGGALVWDKQPLVLATEDGATANDVRALMRDVQRKVFITTKLHITPEVRVM